MPSFYYPEGYFGPVCDALVSDEEIASRGRRAITDDEGDDREYPGGEPGGDGFDNFEDITGEEWNIPRLRCQVDEDGNYFNCLIDTDDTEIDPYWLGLTKGFGLSDTFFVPFIDAESCSPFDSDINIRPTTRFNNGVETTYYKRQRSNPVTYAVESNVEFVPQTSTISATFNRSGDFVVTGTGSGVVNLAFEWDDNPNAYGTALGTYSVAGVTFIQTPNVETGDDSAGASVDAGNTYTATISNNPGGFVVQNSGTEICFRDNDGNDCNATVRITGTSNVDTLANEGYWSEEGNTYAVWTNPATCTLPQLEQLVTYEIAIPSAGTYGFQLASDDNAEIFLNDSTTALLSGPGGIFAGGSYTTPYSTTTTLSAGTLRLTVKCTNSDAGFQDSEGNPDGLAYDWGRNPGGWFVKICQGGACGSGNSINWVQSGPHPAWSSFMNQYAVYPSNTESLVDTVHSATWNVDITTTGTHTLEVQADNTADFTWGSTSLGTHAGFTSSTTYNISITSTGSYTLTAAVTNVSSTVNNFSNNPGGVAWVLRDPSNNVIITSLELSSAPNGNLFWHTRMATGYEQYTV